MPSNKTNARRMANGGISLYNPRLVLTVRTTLAVSAAFSGITASGGLTKPGVRAAVAQAEPL